jgi:hypothetical protein
MSIREGEIHLPPLAQAFALPPSSYMTLPPIHNTFPQYNSKSLQGSQAGGEEDAEMADTDTQEPIDFPKRYDQLVEYIKDTKIVC